MKKTCLIGVVIFTTVSIALAQKQSVRRVQNRSVEQVIRQLDQVELDYNRGLRILLRYLFGHTLTVFVPPGTFVALETTPIKKKLLVLRMANP